MERPCPIRRAGCLSRVSLGHAIAALRPRRGCLRSGWPKTSTQRRLECCGIGDEGSYDTGLTRSQEGRRQKRARRRAPSSETPGWSPSEPATSRSEWLQGAKGQRTEVLLAALLSPESVPLARLPVLLTLVEGRPDLRDCVLAAGLSPVAAAVLRSDMLQRLLPGGAMLELLMGLMEERAAGLAAEELLTAARLIAAWRPPASCEVLARAAVAVVAALVARSLEPPAAVGAEGSSGGSKSGETAAATAGDANVAALAEALAVLLPWLEWRVSGRGESSGQALLSPGVLGVEGSDEEEGPAAQWAGEVLRGARAAVAALVRRVTCGPATTPEPSAVFVVLAAAVQYGVDVPQDFAKTAARMAVGATPVPSTTSASSPPHGEAGSAQLTAQLVAHACRSGGADPGSASGGGGGGISLTAAEVRDLVAPQLSNAQQSAFLAALLSALRERSLVGIVAAGPASSTAVRATAGEEAAEATAGLLQALGGAAGRLSLNALALAMGCAAEAAASVAASVAGPLAARGDAEEAGAAAAEQLLAAAAGAVGACTPDELCRLAAAAARLQRCGIAGSTRGDAAAAAAAHASKLLEAVRAAPLQDVSVDAAAALLSAAAAPAGGVPEPLLESLIDRIAAAADRKTTAVTVQRPEGVSLSPPAGAAAPPSSLSYDQAVGVLAAVVDMAEAAVEAAPSTSGSGGAAAATPAVPPARAAALRAAALVSCRAATPAVRELDAAGAIRLLHLVSRAERSGVRPDFPQLLWALHERLRALAASLALAPTDVLDVLRGCVWLQWRPTVLLRELLLPMLRWLQLGEDGELAASAPTDGPAAPKAAVAGGGATAAKAWSQRQLMDCLALLAKLRFSGPFASAVVKLGLLRVLRMSGPEAAGAGGGSTAVAATPLTASDLAMLLWVCVSTRYRGATVLRPLLQQLLQVPPARVPVKAAAQAVWAAVRLGVVGERLVRWALASCQGADKLAEAAPQSLANLCWGLAKLGVRPPRAFVTAAAAASQSQLRNFKSQELATLLFVLASWGGRLRGGTDAANVVQHVVATRGLYDGPALCTAVWALQRLTAPTPTQQQQQQQPEAATPADDDAGSPSSAANADDNGGAGGAAALDAAALLAFEDQLLAVNLPADPRVGFPDHHLLRYFSACAAAGCRPERLLRRYVARLLPRLRSMRGVSPADAPAEAARRSRMLWSASRIMAAFELRNPDLLTALEVCAERCQSQLLPGHLAGLLNAMAALGYYPARWAERGLLRRVGLALRRATLTEAGLIMEALAAWKPYLTAAPPPPPPPGAAAVEVVAGDGLAAGSGEEVEVEVTGTHRLRGPTVQRVDLLRRVALARLTQLCAPPPAPPPTPPPPPPTAQQPPVGSGSAVGLTSAAAVVTAAPAFTESATAAAPPPPLQQAATTTGVAAVAPAVAAAGVSISLDDAMRLLTALAKLRWQCAPVESALVRVAARLPLERRRRVPELTTLMWALASLRQDSPELLDDLQAALLGMRHQPSLADEITLFESGRVAAIRTADGTADPASAAAAGAAAAAVSAKASPLVASEPSAAAASAEAAARQVGGASSPEPSASGSDGAAGKGTSSSSSSGNESRAQVGSSASSGSGSSSSGAEPDATSTPGDGANGGDIGSNANGDGAGGVSSGDEATLAARRDVQLLSRPAKPAAAVDAAAAEANGSGSAAAAHFDPAAVMAAAAAAVNERYERQLDGTVGRSQLPTEPWAPADIFKTLWACAKLNRHPGPLVLAAAERSWLQYAAAAVSPDGGGAATAPAVAPAAALPPPPLHTVTGLLWSLSVFRHHNGSFAQRLAEQLGAWLRDGDLLAGGSGGKTTVAAKDDEGDASEPHHQQQEQQQRRRELQEAQQRRQQAFAKQSVQVAACLLAAQADRVDSPLNATLPPEVRARLVAAWRSRLAQRLARPPNRYQADIVAVLRKMGFTAAANVATPDGCALVDVAVALRQPAPPPAAPGAPSPPPPPPRLLALELVGRHNTAANSPRILGEAVIKYRLLQARGYLVVPIPCSEWDRIDHNAMWTKMVYLQTKIDRRTGGLPPPATGPAAAAPAPANVAAAAAAAATSSSSSSSSSSNVGDVNGGSSGHGGGSNGSKSGGGGGGGAVAGLAVLEAASQRATPGLEVEGGAGGGGGGMQVVSAMAGGAGHGSQ